MSGYRVAIVGATGRVGQEFLKILEERIFPISSLSLFASDKSAGKKVKYCGNEYTVQETTDDSFKDIDIAFFSAGTDISKHFAPIAARSGAVVIDNSAAWRQDPEVPLVVPEINPEDISLHKGIIANPNCSTIQMVVALYPLHKVNPIKRLVITTLQAVSGTGLPAINELNNQVKQYVAGDTITSAVYPHQIAFNPIPEIDVFLDSGYTKEEQKMVDETHKIMHAYDIKVSATCVRVPVFACHSEAVSVEFTNPIEPARVREILETAPGVIVQDDVSTHTYPLAIDCAGKDASYVGRIRKDISCDNGIVMWIVSDNIRKGAALNAVQIGEYMIHNGMI
jgi:aspartate-semialdehyde dehydrogenase